MEKMSLFLEGDEVVDMLLMEELQLYLFLVHLFYG